MDTAYDEGREERTLEIVENALKMNLSMDAIMGLTGLTKEEITKLKG